LAARTDVEHFARERSREERETHELPETEAAEVAQVFRGYVLPEQTVVNVVDAIRSDRRRWVDFMITFELGMTEPDPRRARNSALTIGLSYVRGGLVPLAPYFLSGSVRAGLIGSVLLTLIALFVFGVIKGRFTTNRPVRSGWQTVLVGGVAAAAAFVIVRMFE
jgi:VIT1/CCC1 family predicted Fe2+/Mn2+ transporter